MYILAYGSATRPHKIPIVGQMPDLAQKREREKNKKRYLKREKEKESKITKIKRERENERDKNEQKKNKRPHPILVIFGIFLLFFILLALPFWRWSLSPSFLVPCSSPFWSPEWQISLFYLGKSPFGANFFFLCLLLLM